MVVSAAGVFHTPPHYYENIFTQEVIMKHYTEEAVAFYEVVKKFKKRLGVRDDKRCLKIITSTPDLLTDFLYQVREGATALKENGVWKH